MTNTGMCEIVHFRVSGEFITERARELFACEGWLKAFHFLTTAFPTMSEDMKKGIWEGKLKLVGIDEFTVEEDNVITSRSGMLLREPVRKKATPVSEDEEDLFEERQMEVMSRKLATLKSQGMHDLAKNVAAVIRREVPLPKPDRALNGAHGWIKPDGKFFACGYGEHLALAACLDFTGEQLEKTWVKVQNAAMAGVPYAHLAFDFYKPDRGVTQAQLNTMDRWCDKHNRPLPLDINEWLR